MIPEGLEEAMVGEPDPIVRFREYTNKVSSEECDAEGNICVWAVHEINSLRERVKDLEFLDSIRMRI